MQKVSIYRDVLDTVGLPCEMQKILKAIKNGRWEKRISELRGLQGEEGQKAFKNTLPCFTPSGLFTIRKGENLIFHSGILIVDFDSKDNFSLVERFGAIRSKLMADQYTYFLFTSCRGNGLAVGVRVEPEKHLKSFLFLERYYMEKYELVVDKGCKDVCRLRFVSHDSELHINEQSKTVEPIPAIERSISESTPARPNASNNAEIMDCIIKSGKLLGGDDYQSWLKIGFSLAQEFGESGRSYFHALSRQSAKYDRADCDRKYDNCLRTNKGAITFASIVRLAKDAGVDMGEAIALYPERAVSGDSKKAEKLTQAQKLIKLADGFVLFHDDTKECYAFINNIAIKIKSRSFKQLLSKRLWEQERESPNTEAVGQCLNVVEAKARFDGACRPLYNKVATLDGKFYYDLGNGRSVCTTAGGWKVLTDNLPILFQSYSHQQPQPLPKEGGDIRDFFSLINIGKDSQLLSLVYIISLFIPDISHPILHPFGSQGAGKTTLFRFLKRLVDPSAIDSFITPKDDTQLVQMLSHHYFCAFDNLSGFSGWVSDLFAMACTGAGFSKRRLYSDDEDVVCQIRRPIAVNGIDLLISRADLMDRAILLRVDRIEPHGRKEMKELLSSFEAKLPFFLGSIFKVLSKAMAIHPTVKLRNLPRMADFAVWGAAIAEGLGYAQSEFLEAYQKNVDAQNMEVINTSTLAQAVIRFMEDKEFFEGTVAETYQNLSGMVRWEKEDKTFPRGANKMRAALNRIKANLADMGISYNIDNFQSKKGVLCTLRNVRKVSTLSTLSTTIQQNQGLQGVDTNVDTTKIYVDTQEVSTSGDPSKIKGDIHNIHNIHSSGTFLAGNHYDGVCENSANSGILEGEI